MADRPWNGYRPGVRGWWDYLRLRDALTDGDGPQWRTIIRRARPSARLRQSERERKYWANEARSRPRPNTRQI